MPRPRKPRFCKCEPCSCYFKPRGVPLRNLKEVVVEKDEFEALKLCDLDDLDQISASKQMKISQPTFARILHRAHSKVADALINGKAVKIKKN